MNNFDYIVVGAGSAGCVLANRLSADPGVQVLLIEAGGRDKSTMIRIPKGFGKLLGDPKYSWFFKTQPFGPTGRVETWSRGKTLGGSSAINGLVYNRGAPADWEQLEELGNKGWGWDAILPAYRQIEDNELGASPTRGTGGPLHISRSRDPDPLCEEMVATGPSAGLVRVGDLNETDEPRIGHTMATIRRGQRVSAADAFLHPVRQRSNLTVEVDALATRLIFEGDRVVGVETQQGDARISYRASREVVLSLGSLGTPKLLQLSGLGPTDVLRAAGIDVRLDRPNIGRRMREHRCFRLQYRLTRDAGYNKQLSSAMRQNLAGIKYLITRKGPLAAPSYDVIGFVKSDPALDRPDGQMLMAPFSVAAHAPGKEIALEREPGLQCIGFVLRPDSEGSVEITSCHPNGELNIDPNYFATAHDREVGLAIFGRMREFFARDPIARWIDHETLPGPSVQGAEELVDIALEHGFCGYHAIGTCAMGPDNTDVVDTSLRVRGVEGLRVMDCSVLPAMVAGNLNGPMMAMAWRAAELILDAR